MHSREEKMEAYGRFLDVLDELLGNKFSDIYGVVKKVLFALSLNRICSFNYKCFVL